MTKTKGRRGGGRGGSRPQVTRNAEMVYLYKTGKYTLQAIGDLYRVTRERVRQVVARADRWGAIAPVASVRRVKDVAAELEISINAFKGAARTLGVGLYRERFISDAGVERVVEYLCEYGSARTRTALGVDREELRQERVSKALDRVPKGAPDECWLWPGSVDAMGYPIVSLFYNSGTARDRLVAKMVWEREYGPLPKGRRIFRKCGNRRCLNPNHMRLNMGRATHCKRGHKYTGMYTCRRYNATAHDWVEYMVQRCEKCDQIREQARRERAAQDEPAERPEFPVYYDAQGNEHGEY